MLLGYMGSGKSTLGKPLARELGVQFFDLDRYLEDRFHTTVPKLFAEKGEEGFRDVERRMLHEVAEFEDVVIACGGGTPCFFDNMDYMNLQGETVFLKAETHVLQAHLMMGKTQRPLIQGKSPEELTNYINESLEQRVPFYSKAKHTVSIDLIERNDQIMDYVKKIIEMCGVTPKSSESNI
jgi:shikimate kinase